ncbi:NB-ARC domain-containing protein [Iningainema tapete]|uniref:NACHT domain-containing protein n=1 Tax=Iningainema tapete BLCC-T55 TaxID=2748662 RepID=A0A8J7C8X0_9CYAN|nr:NB-ARC domain-containing protein [Iningainema tapete]MBD2775246.1 NACHT domain-containing protein [Iningainema tapete BLCC-T55]
MRQRATLKASEQGKNLINQARRSRGWIIEDENWLIEASKILDPNLPPGVYASGVSLTTWKHFLRASRAIYASTFKAFCEVLELNWKNVVILNIDLTDAPELSSFYGRTNELKKLHHWLQERSRLVVIHGVGGIGKTALARQLGENIASKYDYIIWRSLDYTQTFQQLLKELVQFLSKGQDQEVDISRLMKYLRNHRCLLVLDEWKEIIDKNSQDYQDYSHLLRRVGKENHQSSLLLLSREKPQNIENLEGQLIHFLKLEGLSKEEAKQLFIAEGISGKEDELDKLSSRYTNPWIIKQVTKQVKRVCGGQIPSLVGEISLFFTDTIVSFLDEQFKNLSQLEINIIYWIAIRRNSASMEQLRRDTLQTLSALELFNNLDFLIERYSLVDKTINEEDNSIFYTLDPVIMKYITNKFVEDNCQDLLKIIPNQTIEGYELFISHSFITSNPEDEQLKQEQITRIVKPIHKNLLAELRSQQRVEEELRKIMSLLQDRGFSQGYASENILHLISASGQI